MFLLQVLFECKALAIQQNLSELTALLAQFVGQGDVMMVSRAHYLALREKVAQLSLEADGVAKILREWAEILDKA